MKPRWYFKGQRFTDEVGTFSFPVRQSGWYFVINHYGDIKVIPLPPGFWRGLKLRFLCWYSGG